MAEQSKQSKGGKALAAKLTKEERSENARKAAAVRWKTPRATHDGVLAFGDLELACANLPDGRRVVSQESILAALGRGYSGYYSQRDKKARKEGSAVLPQYLAPKALKPFIPKELEVLQYVQYVSVSGGLAKGVEADLIPDICEVWMKASAAPGVKLSAVQKATAAKAQIIVLGLAKVGIIALIDEATGYQAERHRTELQELLREFISDKLRQWVKTFPDSYTRELCRLRNVPFRADMRLPRYFGRLTSNIIYKRLHPNILAELERLNPSENGRRKHKHFQWLSEGFGHPALLRHMGGVLMLMRLSRTWEEFMEQLDRAAPITSKLPLLVDQIADDH